MATQEIPVLKRQETALKETHVPEFQRAFEAYGEASNMLSVAGSGVAQSASNAMAAQLGYQSGLHPSGNVTPPLTEFDRNFANSYHQQADATLTIAAEKMFTETQIALASKPRISPEQLQKTNAQLRLGLSRISETAPTAIKGKLDASFSSSLLAMNKQIAEKMISDNRTDDKNRLDNAIEIKQKEMFKLSDAGDKEGVERLEKSIHEMITNGQNNYYYDPSHARVLKETATQTKLDALGIHDAEQAYKAGKSAEYFKDYADKKLAITKGMTNDQFVGTGTAITHQIQFLQGLKATDENIRSQQMLNRIVTDVGSISNTEWLDYTSSVSPLKAEQVNFHRIQALKKDQNNKTAMNFMKAAWGSATAHANADPKLLNSTFNNLVDETVERSNTTTIPLRSPTPLTRDQAEVQVAANAGGEIPVFTKSLKDKLSSPNPAMIESAIQQISALYKNGNGQALKGLNDTDLSMYSAAKALRNSPDPIKAAQNMHNLFYNQDPDIQQLHNQKFQNILTKQNSAGVSNDQFALNTFHFNKNQFLSPSIAEAYGMHMLRKLKSFHAISGDLEQATELAQESIDQEFGDEYVNGDKHKSMNPIGKRIGFTGRDGTPFIQQNIVEQLNKKLEPIKERYNTKENGQYISNEYWETIPVEIPKGSSVSETLKKRFFEPGGEIDTKQFEKPEGGISLPGNPQMEPDLVDRAISSLTHRAEITPANKAPTEEPSREHGVFFKTYDPIKIKRHIRTAAGEKVDTFNVILIGTPFGDYEVNIQTKHGRRNLFQEAPYLNIQSVNPEDQKILDNYNKAHNLKQDI